MDTMIEDLTEAQINKFCKDAAIAAVTGVDVGRTPDDARDDYILRVKDIGWNRVCDDIMLHAGRSLGQRLGLIPGHQALRDFEKFLLDEYTIAARQALGQVELNEIYTWY